VLLNLNETFQYSIQNWLEFKIWSLKNSLIWIQKYQLRLSWNLAQNWVICMNGKPTKWCQEAFYAQKRPIFSLNPTHHPLWTNFEWKCTSSCTITQYYTESRRRLQYFSVLQLLTECHILNENYHSISLSDFSLISFADLQLILKFLFLVFSIRI